MKCSKCGAELKKDSNFCPFCGMKVETETFVSSAKYKGEPDKKESAPQITSTPLARKPSIANKAKGKFTDYWNKIDLFCKIETIAISVSAFLLLIALGNGKVPPIIFSVLQLCGLVVALLLHKGKIKYNEAWLKYLILAVSIVLVVPYISSYSWLNKSPTNIPTYENFFNVDTPYSAKECIGKEYEIVKDDFRRSGFTNISLGVIEDLEISEADRDGIVESVSINGVSDFEGNVEFKNSSKIVITYHSFKNIGVPFSSDEAKSMDTELIIEAFDEAGFMEIMTDEAFDLDPDITESTFENLISINGTETFDKDATFPPNAEVKIVTHKPYEKYTLKIEIDFVPNLIFSTYDVKMEIDGHTETLKHGEDGEFEYRIKSGKYTLNFCSADSDSVNGSVDLNITNDTDASFKINCYNDKVSVETLNIGELGIYGEDKSDEPESSETVPTTPSEPETVNPPSSTVVPEEDPPLYTEPEPDDEVTEMVWIPSSGSKYHSYSSCSNMKNPRQVTLEEAQSMGYTPCKRCH